MRPAQSSPVPRPGTKPRPADWGWLVAYTVRGLGELVRARMAFARLKAADIPRRNRAAAMTATRNSLQRKPVVAARIGYVLPRISARLPWRSDCLVQAIAAQNWLVAYRLFSEIRIGVEKPDAGPFGAHAWLVYDGTVVTGGDVTRYDVLLTEEPVVDTTPPQRTADAASDSRS